VRLGKEKAHTQGGPDPARDPDKQTAQMRDVIGACAIFLIIAAWKSPVIFRHPRFWAEDATSFYASFLHGSFLNNIFYIKSGSFQILTNVIVDLAVQVPIVLAPTITTYLALSLHLVIVVQIVLFACAYELGKAIALLLIASWALLPQTYEVWLNASNAQWVAGVSVLFLFAMPTEWVERHFKTATGACLVYAVSGVPSVLLAPLFLLRAAVERSRPIATLGILLGAGAGLQLAVLASVGEPRPFPADPLVLVVPLFLQSVLAPVLSGDVANEIALWILTPNAVNSATAVAGTLAIGLAIMSVATVAASSSGRKIHALFLLLACILVTEVQNFGAIEPEGHISGWSGARYFLFGSMCMCLLLAWGTKARQVFLRVASTGLLCITVLTGAAEAILSFQTKSMTHGPSWRRQIDACQPKEACKITVWPGGPWIVEIRK
jgi:hypothetical protein